MEREGMSKKKTKQKQSGDPSWLEIADMCRWQLITETDPLVKITLKWHLLNALERHEASKKEAVTVITYAVDKKGKVKKKTWTHPKWNEPK